MYWFNAPNIPVKHGFSTRNGGVSPAPFDSLNLAGSEDSKDNIFENRKRALSYLNLQAQQVAYLNQVHGTQVCIARPGAQTGDALVSNENDLVLAVAAADCYPILFCDPINHVIAAAHAGWRGTVAKIAKKTLEKMTAMGADLKELKVAIGPGISCANFEVGPEVIEQFVSAGFPPRCFEGMKINLLLANLFVLEECGVPSSNTWAMNRCTTDNDFFSFRRDNGKTGRMWAIIAQ